mgnify:CR=1 FL=1
MDLAAAAAVAAAAARLYCGTVQPGGIGIAPGAVTSLLISVRRDTPTRLVQNG